MPALFKKSRDELEEIALKRIRARPGCRGAAAAVLTLDDDGEWSFEVSDPGSADAEAVRHAAIAVGHAMHDELIWRRTDDRLNEKDANLERRSNFYLHGEARVFDECGQVGIAIVPEGTTWRAVLTHGKDHTAMLCPRRMEMIQKQLREIYV